MRARSILLRPTGKSASRPSFEEQALTCPNCNGVLSKVRGAKPLRFRCQVGHARTADIVAKEQENAVDEALRTPAVIKLFHLVETDVGRPIGHIKSRILYGELQDDARRVIRSLGSVDREIDAKTALEFSPGVRCVIAFTLNQRSALLGRAQPADRSDEDDQPEGRLAPF